MANQPPTVTTTGFPDDSDNPAYYGDDSHGKTSRQAKHLFLNVHSENCCSKRKLNESQLEKVGEKVGCLLVLFVGPMMFALVVGVCVKIFRMVTGI